MSRLRNSSASSVREPGAMLGKLEVSSAAEQTAVAIAAAAGVGDWATRAPEARSLPEYHRDHQLRLDV